MADEDWSTLTEALEELERTNPEVRRARENYDRTVARILARPTERMLPEHTDLRPTEARDQLEALSRDLWNGGMRDEVQTLRRSADLIADMAALIEALVDECRIGVSVKGAPYQALWDRHDGDSEEPITVPSQTVWLIAEAEAGRLTK